MFQWSDYWRQGRAKPGGAPTEKFGGLKQFARTLTKIWPKRDSHAFFSTIVWLVTLVLVFLGCWFFTEWLFPVNLLVSIPAALVLTRIVFVVMNKVSTEKSR
jgi:hypothetical protein